MQDFAQIMLTSCSTAVHFFILIKPLMMIWTMDPFYNLYKVPFSPNHLLTAERALAEKS